MSTEPRTSAKATLYVSVPAWQKAEWEAHANELDMNLSEFARAMIQAGRNGFSSPDPHHSSDKPTDLPTDGFTDRILTLITEDGPLEYEDLVDRTTDHIEDRVDEALVELQQTGRILHRRRDGGYIEREE